MTEKPEKPQRPERSLDKPEASRPSGMKWYKNEDIPRWIGALSAALSAAAIIVAVSSYLLARYGLETELVVSAPEVIEFRCSTASFEPSDCAGEASNFVYLSLTAAFRISAVGPDLHEAALKGMDALVSIPRSDGTTDVYRLRSFWSGDLVGTENPGLKQSVPLSLKGGQSISQEIWFSRFRFFARQMHVMKDRIFCPGMISSLSFKRPARSNCRDCRWCSGSMARTPAAAVPKQSSAQSTMAAAWPQSSSGSRPGRIAVPCPGRYR